MATTPITAMRSWPDAAVDSDGKQVLYFRDADGTSFADLGEHLRVNQATNARVFQPTRDGGYLPHQLEFGGGSDALYGAKRRQRDETNEFDSSHLRRAYETSNESETAEAAR